MSKSANRKTNPIDSPKEVKGSKDPKIDQDVPGFPDHPSSKEDIRKKTTTDKLQKK